MPWTNLVHPEYPIIEICCTGLITPNELAEGFREAFELARQHSRTRMLTDCTSLAGGHSITDLYFLADALTGLGALPVYREAVLVPTLPQSAESVQFWETACANRGLDVRLFDNRKHALDWLLKPGRMD
jgi:hypothetical protein